MLFINKKILGILWVGNFIIHRMNEFLEQLVRDLTNAYSRSQKCLVSVYHLAPQISEAFSVFLVAGGQMLLKQQPLIHLNCLCSVSIPISVFLRTRFMMSFAKDKGLSLNTAALQPVSKTTSTANFWTQIILDPYRRPLTLTFLHVSTRGLFQDTMFDRLHYSTLSEDASEVLVQPLPCGTEKATSVARVVAKPTPRLCSRCASNT